MKKYKKKISLLLTIICLLAFSVTTFAKNKAVTISGAEATKTTVTVSGTTEALAVMVQIRDTDDNILKMESFGTVSGAFTGKIEGLTLKEDTEYTVYIADYEGGDWTIATITVPKTTTESTTEATTEATTAATTEATTAATTETAQAATTEAANANAKAPQTGDNAPIMLVISLMLLSALSLRFMLKRK